MFIHPKKELQEEQYFSNIGLLWHLQSVCVCLVLCRKVLSKVFYIN